jgi:hypothetical protein
METLKTEQHPSSLVKVLASWPFLLFLTALLLNDWWLKRAFPGLVTGKLSDFAGIALVGTLAMTIWPSHVFRAAAIIAAGFIWWKGPLSQTAIKLFGASGAEKAEALRKKLKALLAERFSGLEYVEPLQSRSLPAPAK